MNPGPDAAQWYANNVAIWALIITAVGVVVSGVIAYLAIGQFRAAKASADAARESVAEAHQSVQFAKDALQTGNRAWVHVRGTPVQWVNQPPESGRVACRVDLVLQNYGSTPTVTFMAEGRLELLPDFPTTEKLQFNVTDKNGVSVISPGNEFPLPTAYLSRSSTVVSG
jgi:hypothetical protein